MNRLGPGYHFAKPEHWRECLVSGARYGAKGLEVPLRAFSPLVSSGGEPAFATPGAAAPAYTWTGETIWRAGAATLHRLPAGDESAAALRTGGALATTPRFMPTCDSLWAARPDAEAVECFELETLSLRFAARLRYSRVIDLAPDGREGVLALVARGGAGARVTWCVVRIDCSGAVAGEVDLEGLHAPVAFAPLGADRLAVLAHGGARVELYPAAGGTSRLGIALATLATCFEATCIASDSRGRLVVAGVSRPERGRQAPLLVTLDASLRKLEQVGLFDKPTGVAAAGERVLVTAQRGLFALEAGTRVPETTAAIETLVVSPFLEAPEAEDGRRWLRIEAAAALPPGTSLELAYLATDDAREHAELSALASDSSLPRERRAELLRAHAGFAALAFAGNNARASGSAAPLAMPLHDARGKWLWVAVSLAANAGAELPALHGLSVLYPGVTLMSNLPAIYQRDEVNRGSAIRGLVGVLETTTQELDARIASLGRFIHPSHAPERWLDYLARWLGVPWSDSLAVDQKQRILLAAERIAAARGSRAGLELLLESLFPGAPPRFRVTDATADVGFAIAGGPGCAGSALPALLAPARESSARLGSRLPIERVRLVCPDEPCDLPWQHTPTIRVDLAVGGAARARSEPWLESLLAELVPFGTRLQLRWVSRAALRGTNLDDEGTLVLRDPPPPVLDGDAVTGLSHLPQLDSGLSDADPTVGAPGCTEDRRPSCET